MRESVARGPEVESAMKYGAEFIQFDLFQARALVSERQSDFGVLAEECCEAKQLGCFSFIILWKYSLGIS